MSSHFGGDSLANTLRFLTQGRQIPEASPEFLQSARNPNIRNFAPGQEPQFKSGLLKSLAFGNPVQENTPQIDQNGNPAAPPQGNQGALANIMRMLGLGNVGDPLLGRQQKIDDILNQANQ